MPATKKSASSKPKSTASKSTSKTPTVVPHAAVIAAVQTEIERLVTTSDLPRATLEAFSQFILRQVYPPQPLSIKELQKAIYQHFEVANATELKKSGSFKLASSGLGKLSLSDPEDCKKIYRRLIGVLPEEEGEVGYGCINGINIFKYDLPWRVFGLDPEKATDEDIKTAYRNLSKIYHPDIPNTGDDKIFQKINIYYKSLTEKFEQWQ
ncbi:MAG: DnaJ domain-containing protein [Cyanobacteriota bacterium]|nr:DnaJ domain-containing protein [Cyanobacteriota bacterium]